MKCDPVIADFAPTKGHSGRGVRSHIEEKSPNPIAAVARVGRRGGCSRDARGMRTAARVAERAGRVSQEKRCAVGGRALEVPM